MTITPEEAQLALGTVETSRSRLSQLTRWPLWRHMAFAGVEALLILSINLPTLLMLPLVLLAFAGLAWIVHDDRRRYGMFVSGWQGRATRMATLAITAFVLAAAAFAIWHRGSPDSWQYGAIAAAVVFVVCTAGSLWWQHLYNAELTQAGRA